MKIFIKNNMKVFVSIFVTTIVVGSISVYASSILARDISFTPNNDNFKATNVEDAINQLYDKVYVTGEFYNSSNEKSFINLGFRPNVIFMVTPNSGNSTNYNIMYYYDSKKYNDKILVGWGRLNSSSGVKYNENSIYNFAVSDNGFTMQANSSEWVGETIYYAFK